MALSPSDIAEGGYEVVVVVAVLAAGVGAPVVGAPVVGAAVVTALEQPTTNTATSSTVNFLDNSVTGALNFYRVQLVPNP